MSKLIPGPTYEEMFDPRLLPPEFHRQAAAARSRELDPANLFNISWRAPNGSIRCEVLPKELTGVDANILVLIGRDFPSGSHKVGAAYSTLLEGELAGEIAPGEHTIVGPSTGNFGIGTAYVGRLKGYSAVVIMPDQMSAERYERIRRYGAQLDLTPGCESDVILVIERTEHYKRDPKNKILAQFELFPNYRFHRHVTGGSALEAARQYGNGRIAAFVSAPGSAGTLAAGDAIKQQFPDALICAPEPVECPTLFHNGRGPHRIEGIGDKMVTLIHNVLTTDYVMLIHDDDCVIGLHLLEQRPAPFRRLQGMFGISGICNILGAIRLARFLRLGPGDNVVTIATDGFDRYPSVMADLARRMGEIKPDEWFEKIFRGGESRNVLDVRSCEEKERLFRAKEDVWKPFGYSQASLDAMKSQSFWDAEYARIPAVDEALLRSRRPG
ncbi:MAG TPA: pyridoxal-phosphate dependent enzyme [Bryobacteraceae bacterium]|nr:pyridoxal-phosphate dependent enzyme [Bryobacteraceae bacterium]